jgi:hypothetical protein
MTDQDRLDRIERKLDLLGQDVFEIKLAFAEFKGARKVLYTIASIMGAVAGILAAFFTRGKT